VAANYAILASESTTETHAGAELRNVFQITAQAVPSGIVFHRRFPPSINDPENIDTILSIWAGWLNELNATPGVVSVQWVQDINAADEIQDRLVVTIDSTDGVMRFTREDIPLSDTVAEWQAAVAQTRAQLDAIEAR
jgi:hypothetical protein